MKGSYVLMTFLLQEWLFHRIYLKQQLLHGASEVLGIAFSLAENRFCKHGYEPVTKMFWEPLFYQQVNRRLMTILGRICSLLILNSLLVPKNFA